MKKYLLLLILTTYSLSANPIKDSLSNEVKKNDSATRYRVYLHPFSKILYESPEVFYATVELEIIPKWTLIGQYGSESGSFHRGQKLSSGSGNDILINEMEEIKFGIRKYFLFKESIGPFIDLQVGQTTKDFKHYDISAGKTHIFKYDGFSYHTSMGVAYSYYFTNIYLSSGVIFYEGKRESETSMYWDELPLIDINIGIGVGY